MASVRRLDPPTPFDAGRPSFTQVAISTGQVLVHIAGQAALDRDLTVVGAGDFARQLEVALENLRVETEAVAVR